jgi:hypothetical protein
MTLSIQKNTDSIPSVLASTSRKSYIVSHAKTHSSPVDKNDFCSFPAKAAHFLKSFPKKADAPLPSRPLLDLNYYANLAQVLLEENENWLQVEDWSGKRNRAVLKSLTQAIADITEAGEPDCKELVHTCTAILDTTLLMHEDHSGTGSVHGITVEVSALKVRDLLELDPSRPIDKTQSDLIGAAIGDLLKALDADPRFRSKAVAKNILKRLKIVSKSERFHREATRPVDQKAALDWLRGREIAREKPKTGLTRYLKRGQPEGDVEDQPTRSEAYDCVMRDFRKAVDPDNVLREHGKRDNGTHVQEGLHAFAGRLVTLSGWAVGTAIPTLAGKFLIHQVVGSMIAPFVTASGRMLTDTSKNLTRKYNPILPSTVRNAPECSTVAKEFRAARAAHRNNVLTAQTLLAQNFSLDGVADSDRKQACDDRLALLDKCKQDLHASAAELKKVDKRYRLSVAHGRFQHYGKGAGAIADTVSSAVLTPLTVAIPKIGIPAQAVAAVGRLVAGGIDDKTSVRTSERMAMKYAEPLPPELRDISAAHLLETQIPREWLRALAKGRTQARPTVVQDAIKQRLAQLHDQKEALENIETLSPSQEQKLKKINGKIERFGLDWERLLEPARWHEIDPQSLAGRILRKQFFAWRKGIREQFSRPGALFAQAAQRYAGNLHASVSTGEALLANDVLTAAYGDGHFHSMPDDVQTGDLASMAAGGTVLGVTAGVVRHEKQTTRSIFTPPVPAEQRWIVRTPNGKEIDLTNTGVDHKRRYTLKRRTGMAGLSLARAMVSGPVSLSNLWRAAYQRRLARNEWENEPGIQRRLDDAKHIALTTRWDTWNPGTDMAL